MRVKLSVTRWVPTTVHVFGGELCKASIFLVEGLKPAALMVVVFKNSLHGILSGRGMVRIPSVRVFCLTDLTV